MILSFFLSYSSPSFYLFFFFFFDFLLCSFFFFHLHSKRHFLCCKCHRHHCLHQSYIYLSLSLSFSLPFKLICWSWLLSLPLSPSLSPFSDFSPPLTLGYKSPLTFRTFKLHFLFSPHPYPSTLSLLCMYSPSPSILHIPPSFPLFPILSHPSTSSSSSPSSSSSRSWEGVVVYGHAS